MRIDLSGIEGFTEAPEGYAARERRFDHKNERICWGLVTGTAGRWENVDGRSKGTFSLTVQGYTFASEGVDALVETGDVDASAAVLLSHNPEEFRVFVSADLKHRLCKLLNITLGEFDTIGPDGWKACNPLVGRSMLFFFVGSESESPNSKHLFQAGVIDAEGPDELAIAGLTVIKRALESGVSLKPWSPYGDGGDSNNPL